LLIVDCRGEFKDVKLMFHVKNASVRKKSAPETFALDAWTRGTLTLLLAWYFLDDKSGKRQLQTDTPPSSVSLLIIDHESSRCFAFTWGLERIDQETRGVKF
jgi:hypothetical protein